VLAGVNGAGKSSLGGARIRALGTTYYNPDEAACRIRAMRPALGVREANGLAWNEGRRLLERAIAERKDFAFETTLGATTIPRMLAAAADSGAEVWVWFAGLDSPERHVARVRARASAGGHDIPEADIRRRWESSRENLVALLPKLARLYLYDNSVEADPAAGRAPLPKLILEVRAGKIVSLVDPRQVPAWAKPIVARALQLRPGGMR
jgi:predicted ABC-type ATPase